MTGYLNASIWGLRPGLKGHGQKTAGHPLAQAECADDVLCYAWPSPDWFDYAGMAKAAQGHGEHFVIAGGFSPLFYLIADLCGMEKALMDMIVNPDVTQALVFKISPSPNPGNSRGGALLRPLESSAPPI